jgi:hypothetical protein
VLGEDDPDTLTFASNLAIYLARLGKYRAARSRWSCPTSAGCPGVVILRRLLISACPGGRR